MPRAKVEDSQLHPDWQQVRGSQKFKAGSVAIAPGPPADERRPDHEWWDQTKLFQNAFGWMFSSDSGSIPAAGSIQVRLLKSVTP